jgi:hypothetical protein
VEEVVAVQAHDGIVGLEVIESDYAAIAVVAVFELGGILRGDGVEGENAGPDI